MPDPKKQDMVEAARDVKKRIKRMEEEEAAAEAEAAVGGKQSHCCVTGMVVSFELLCDPLKYCRHDPSIDAVFSDAFRHQQLSVSRRPQGRRRRWWTRARWTRTGAS